MGKIENIRIVDELLSSIAQGYSNAEFISDKIFPVVATRREAGKIPHFTKEAFILDEAVRGMGADSNVIDTMDMQDPISWGLTEYDLASPLDYREVDETDLDLERSKTIILTDKMLLGREKRTANLLQNAGNYTNGNTAAIGVKWTASNSTPIKDIEAASEVIRGNIARRPNTLLLGASAFSALKNHPDFVGRLANTKTAVVTAPLIAEITDIPNVIVGNAIWINRLTGTQSDVWGDNAILAYVPTGVRDLRSMLTPGFGYTLTKKAWAPVDKYTNLGGKVTYIRHTALESPLFHGNIAGYLLQDTNA